MWADDVDAVETVDAVDIVDTADGYSHQALRFSRVKCLFISN